MSDKDYKNRNDISLLKVYRELRDVGSTDGEQKAANPVAAEFYSRYVEQLMRLVKANLAERFSRRIDPVDVTQSVFNTWFKRIEDQRITVESEEEIAKLLMTIALCKVRNKVAFHDRKKRAVGQATSQEGDYVEQSTEPTAEDAAEYSELLEELHKKLGDKESRTLELKLAGNTNVEIAVELGCSEKSVQRYMNRTREVLASMVQDELPE